MSVPHALWRLMSTGKVEGLRRDGGDWKARCPAHQDRVASLAIKVAADGRLLLHCHAGCQTRDVVERWGVSWSVLFPEEPMPNGADAKRERSWDYTDEDGNLLFQVVRRDPGKKFVQRRPLEGGDWAWDLKHVRRVLYHMPQLQSAPPDAWVFVVEGEKDADTLEHHGLVATTNPGGAGKWKEDYARHLRGRRVAILPDNDEAGRAHADQVAASLADVAVEVKILELPGLPKKGDVSDWLGTAGHGATELLELADSVLSVPHTYREEREQKQGLLLIAADELLDEEDIEPPDLVAGLLPEAGLSIVGAKPKVGKSTWVRCLCIAVAQGTEFMNRPVRQGGVIYLALEEKRREVREHFRRLGMAKGDPLYVHFGATPEDGLAALARAIEEKKPLLVVIDPLFRFIQVRDVSDYAVILKALDPVLHVARKTGCHVLLVHHNTKVEREGGDDFLGSTGIFASVDTAIIMRRRTDNSRYAYSLQRYGKDMEPTVITMTEGGLIVPEGSLEAFETQKAGDQILELLRTESEPLPELEITERVALRKQRVIRALRELFDSGRVSRWGTGKRNDPFKFSIPWHAQQEKEEPKE